MNTHLSALGRAVALALAVTGVPAFGSTPATGREVWAPFVEAVGAGRLESAQAELKALRAIAAPQAALDRAGRIIEQRREDAKALVQLAERDLSRADLGAATRRLSLAMHLDQSTLELPVTSRAQAQRVRLDAALATLDACKRKRDAGCMKTSLAQLREIDRFNAAAMLNELAAEDWFAGALAQHDRIDAPPVAR